MARAGIGALALLCAFTGLTATAGGLLLATDRDGSVLGIPLAMLRHSPFDSFLVPGLLLLLAVGLPHLLATLAIAARTSWRGGLALVSGVSLLVYMLTEMALLVTVRPLQCLFVVVALCTIVLGERLLSSDRDVDQPGPIGDLRQGQPS
jgi:hypothetical protein